MTGRPPTGISGTLRLDERILLVAEIGTNHNGSPERARSLIAAAAAAGADAVKLQTFRAERWFTRAVPAFPRARPLGYLTQFDRIRDLELPDAVLPELAAAARERGLLFLSTPFDEGSADLVAPLVDCLKLSSAEAVNLPLLRHVAALGKPVVLSSGMASLEEIDRAVAQFAPGQLALLHCVSSYPTPDDQVHLRVIRLLAARYPVPVGYSDHTVGTLACEGAAALGARIIEKHFTYDTTLPYGDHALSADASQFGELAGRVRRLERMLGLERKERLACEEDSARQLRRSIHLARDARAGERIAAPMLVALVSGRGLSVGRWDEVLGRTLRRDKRGDDALEEDDLGP